MFAGMIYEGQKLNSMLKGEVKINNGLEFKKM